MRNLFLLILLVILLTNNQSAAQVNNGTIRGNIVDIEKQGISGATVTLKDAQNSLFKQELPSNKNGTFNFSKLVNGNYSIEINCKGFQPYKNTSLWIDDKHPTIVLPVIVLQSLSKSLKVVVVSSKKSLVEQKIDRTIVNVDAMLSAAGSNAMDVLAKSPGVMIDANDDISLNGKSNILVLIDDRLTYMSGSSLAAYLRSLPAGMLDKIELISTPPAKYEANGNAIINIVLKKNLAAGFNGTVNIGYNQGVYARSNDVININYRVKKANIFGNAGYSFDKNFNDQSFNRYFYKNDGSLGNQFLQNSFFRTRSNNINIRAGIDYFVSKKTTIGFIINLSERPKNDLVTYKGKRNDSFLIVDSLIDGNIISKYQAQNRGVNFNLQHKFNDKGKILAVNSDLLHYHNRGKQVALTDIYLPGGILIEHQQRFFTLPSDVYIYAVKADYSLPLAAKMQFDAGIKSSYVINDYEYNWYDQHNDSLFPDYSKSNHFRYAENINSAYVSGKKEWSRWAIQAGLRFENTNAVAHQFGNAATNDSAFNKHYTSIFPSLALLYKLDNNGNNTLVLSMGRRISRPSYQQLNPFRFFQDIYTYTTGNPSLVPSFGKYIELKYSYKGFAGVTVGYGANNLGINQVTQTEGNIFLTRPVNYLRSRQLALVPFCSYKPIKWWSVNLQGVFLWQRLKGNFIGVNTNQRNGMHEIEATNQFQLPHDWNAELSLFFPGSQTFGQIKSNAVYNISAGVQKKILHGNGVVRISMSNIFNSTFQRSQTIGINGVQDFNTRNTDNRRLGLSIIYNFGKAANARKKNDTGSADDEKVRVN